VLVHSTKSLTNITALVSAAGYHCVRAWRSILGQRRLKLYWRHLWHVDTSNGCLCIFSMFCFFKKKKNLERFVFIYSINSKFNRTAFIAFYKMWFCWIKVLVSLKKKFVLTPNIWKVMYIVMLSYMYKDFILKSYEN